MIQSDTSTHGDLPESTERRTVIPPAPEGTSKRQWKKALKRQYHKDNKEEYAKVRKMKRKMAKINRRNRIQEYVERGEEIPEELKRPPKVNVDQKMSGIKIILDCSFDELMNQKEIISLSNQITRAYSSNRREKYAADIVVAPFDKRLKKRFEEDLTNCRHDQWNNFKFLPDEDILAANSLDPSKMIYLTADTDEKLEALEEGMTYVVGGIVDKNRHKLLCYNKAKKLGIPARRLPLDEYINLAGRRVLTTTHVVQLILKYFENHDWKEAFEYVLPPRKLDKLQHDDTANDEESDGDERGAENVAQDGESSEAEERDRNSQ